VPLTHPQPHWTVLKARHAGIEVIGDTEVFAREAALAGSSLVAITGTNGKSTTTALTGHVLSAAGLDAEVGGNIGKAVFLLRQPVRGRIYVLELSSFQIDLMPGLRPDVGVLTNLTPDHLDRHGTMENYAAVKARMFARQGSGDTVLCGVDDVWCAAIARQAVATGADVRPVSVTTLLADGISAPDGILRDRRSGEPAAEIDLRAMPALRGRHNWQNACMAYGAARALGVPVRAIADAMQSFPGLAHRMQQVGRVGPVIFVNDSKATNADAAEKALSSFDNIYWILGGIAKSGGIESLKPLFGRVARAYLIGQAAESFSAEIGGAIPTEICATLDRAVAAALRDAAVSDRPGAVVLLSPACASFDQYPNFEVRGDAFVEAVSRLPGAVMTIPGDAHAART
jgi:UDP-N-acetylmuramoylalanine--D-glutamate ligase